MEIKSLENFVLSRPEYGALLLMVRLLIEELGQGFYFMLMMAPVFLYLLSSKSITVTIEVNMKLRLQGSILHYRW